MRRPHLNLTKTDREAIRRLRTGHYLDDLQDALFIAGLTQLDLEALPEAIDEPPVFADGLAAVVVYYSHRDAGGWNLERHRRKIPAAEYGRLQAAKVRRLKNDGRLRWEGWKVIRVWSHQIDEDLVGVTKKILDAVRKGRRDAARHPRSRRSADQEEAHSSVAGAGTPPSAPADHGGEEAPPD